MPEAGQPTPRLADLRERWEQDRGSRIYLQLAEEHRRLGELAEAVTVLEEGLQHRPRDLSGMVALGRCRLELGEVEDAVLVLADVIARDPAHIVANKLLIQAHLERGDAAAARDRLTVYRLLNDRDPELEEIERGLAALDGRRDAQEMSRRTPDETAEEAGDDAAVDATDDAADDERPSTSRHEDDTAVSQRRAPDAALDSRDDSAAGPAASPPRREDLFAATAGAATPPPAIEEGSDVLFPLRPIAGATGLDDLWEAAPGAVRRRDDPFGDLGAPPPASSRGGADVFGLTESPPAPEEPSAEAVEPEPAEPVVEEALAPEPTEPEPTEPEPAAPEVEEPVAPEPAVEPAEPEPEPASAAAVSEPEPAAEEPEPAAEEPEPEAEEPEPAAEEPEPAAEEPEPAAEEPEPEAEEPEPTPAGDGHGEATATLGNLYLAQGHIAEAGRIFQRVLERDPDHEAARQGLVRVEAARARPALRAGDLLASPELAGAIPAGLSAKKILVLQSYLRRLRPGSSADVR